jgi:hypothetical protein
MERPSGLTGARCYPSFVSLLRFFLPSCAVGISCSRTRNSLTRNGAFLTGLLAATSSTSGRRMDGGLYPALVWDQ